MNRREVLQIALQAVAAGAAGWAGGAVAGSAGTHSDRALELVARAQVFDMLGVFTVSDKRERAMLQDPGIFTLEDVRKVLDSGIDVFHNTIGIGGPDAFGTVLH